ncbi:prostaglandin-E synthase [Ranunculus cassubicifolius]
MVQESKINLGVRSIFCVIEKAELGWWKKLLRGDQKTPHYVKVDWDKWADEDDDEAPEDLDVDGMNFSGFGGMGGGGDMDDDFDGEGEEVDELLEQEAETVEEEASEDKTESYAPEAKLDVAPNP